VKLILPMAAAAFVLAGCANAYDRSAGAPACRRLAGEDRPITLPVSGPGIVMGDGSVIPASDLGASGKLDRDWPISSACIRQEHDGTKPQKWYDLRKIGMVL
jgi:hypothetical protein